MFVRIATDQIRGTEEQEWLRGLGCFLEKNTSMVGDLGGFWRGVVFFFFKGRFYLLNPKALKMLKSLKKVVMIFAYKGGKG